MHCWPAEAYLLCVAALSCSGTITVDEMREGLRAKDTKIPEAELEAIMANADVNGDGKVDYEEFVAATMHLGKLEREEHLYRAFQVMLAHLDCLTPLHLEAVGERGLALLSGQHSTLSGRPH